MVHRCVILIVSEVSQQCEEILSMTSYTDQEKERGSKKLIETNNSCG